MNVKTNICRAAVLLVACLCQQAFTARAASPPGCQGCGVAVAPLTSATIVKNGTTVLFDVSVANAIPSACDIVNSTVTFFCPGLNGLPDLTTPHVLTTTLNLPFGATATVASGIPCVISTTSAQTAQASATVTGPAGSCLKGATDQASGSGTTSLQVSHPCLQVTKNCPANNACTPYGQAINFSGNVINCGDEDIDVTLSDNPTATITPSGTFTVVAGATVPYTGSYVPTVNLCGPLSDTITANGTSVLTGTALAPTATASCPVCNNPCVGVTKDCTSLSAIANGSYTVGGTVSNCGNVPLVNVHVIDTIVMTPNVGVATTTTVDVLVNGTLGLSQTTQLTATITGIPANFCGTITDQFSVTADSLCPGVAGAVVHATGNPATSATCTVTIPCPPHLTVTKGVACAPASGTCDGTLTYNPTAAGVQVGAACPIFCYQVVITNDGQDDVQGLVLHDTDSATFSPSVPPTLAIGASFTTYYSKTLCVSDSPHTDTVFATATGVSSLQAATSNNASATATVQDINPNCSIALSSVGSVSGDGTSHLTLLAGSGPGTAITVDLTVGNSGTFPMIITAITLTDGTGAPVALVDCTDNSVPANSDFGGLIGKSVAANNSTVSTTIGCWLEGCPGGTLNIVITASADTSNSTVCIPFNANGGPATVDSSPCTADVICATPPTCRVTGGGVLLPNEPYSLDCSGSTTTTTLFGKDCNGQPAVKITHGGQLGAPYSNPTCGDVAAFPNGQLCIRGQWEHVRHYQGKANRASYIEVDNFHSNNPKGIFDMLQCACLPCCENAPVGVAPVKVGFLCNPSDHKICGPEPRPAPDNSIIFSGVGAVRNCTSSANNKKAPSTSVAFLVYVEDRSEPGGYHPKGGKNPPDIYSFTAWDITGNGIALRQAIADYGCAFLKARSAGTIPQGSMPGIALPDVTDASGVTTPAPTFPVGVTINDQGGLHTGNQQIHPSTSATCVSPIAPQ